jgi:glyoxylase-like metal-dependent hydrolase (beta-lactamase superfamily II)
VIIERATSPQWLSNTYLIADPASGVAAMVDAGGPVEALLDIIEQRGYALAYVLLTHHHGDHIAELDKVVVAQPDAEVLIHPLEIELVPQATGTLQPGQPLSVGAIPIEVLHTPGHTTGMVALLASGSELFTGDTLFRGSVGGLHASGHATYADLKRSIMDTLLRRDAAVHINPGHSEPTTVGAELAQNPFVRVWRGLDPEGSSPCTVSGKPATLIVAAEDYDGGTKAWVRWPDGADDIVPGSRVQVGGGPLAATTIPKLDRR